MLSDPTANWSQCIDDLVNLDVNGRGAVSHLYSAILKLQVENDPPLSLGIARHLLHNVSRGNVVMFLTGFPEMPWIGRGIAETDGPVGTAVLARALVRTRAVIPVVPIEPHFANVVCSAFLGVGLSPIFGDTHLLSEVQPGDPVVIITIAEQGVNGQSLYDSWQPKAVIAIERPGANECGQYHHMSGRNITHCLEDLEQVFRAAKSTGVLTLAIGDGGNEVGMGAVQDTVRQLITNGANCGCGCGGGIAATSQADLVMTATVANWGATAIAASLAMLSQDRSTLASPRLELRSLACCAAAGGVDGSHNEALPSADGVPDSVYQHIIGIISSLVDKALGVNHGHF